MFRLVRYFSLTALVSILVAAIALSSSYRYLAISDLKKFGETQNVNLTQALSNAVGAKIKSLLHVLDKNNKNQKTESRKNAILLDLHKAVLKEVKELPVLKVKLFNREATIIYSSDFDEIGATKSKTYPGNRSAETGAVISQLDFRKSFSSINGVVENRNVLSSYLPIKDAKKQKIIAVLEIYSDMTDFYQSITDAQTLIAIITIIIFLLLYTVLFFIVKHGDTIIKRQASEREENIETIKNVNAMLSKSTAELATAHDDAIAANKAKSQFLADMSHELRTPLHGIMGYSEILQEICVNAEPVDILADLKRIHASGTHLLTLINEIMDFSKIEAGKMTCTYEVMDVECILNEVTDAVSPLINKQNNALILNVPEHIGSLHADTIKVRQILMNLLSNASKFTKQGKITLAVNKLVKDGIDFIAFSVEDDGIGMSHEQAQKVFEPFSQATDTTSRDYGGTGLGLTISQGYSKMMGGSIEVESELNKGTVFTVFLPVDAESVFRGIN